MRRALPCLMLLIAPLSACQPPNPSSEDRGRVTSPTLQPDQRPDSGKSASKPDKLSHAPPEPQTEPEKPPPAVARWLFHAQRMAMVIEVRSTLANQTSSLQTLCELADQDADGSTSWAEISELSELFPRPLNSDRLPPELVRAYDTNGDNMVGVGELRKFLARGQLICGGWLVIEIDSRYERQVASSAFAKLDQDNSGRLEESELIAASDRLIEQDADDDGLIWPSDLGQSRGLVDQRPLSSINSRKYVCPIDEHTNWDDLAFELEQQFSYGARLATTDIPSQSRLIELDRLHGNEDGTIATNELAYLRELEPDATVEISWQPPRVSIGSGPLQGARIVQGGVVMSLGVSQVPTLTPFAELDANQDMVLNRREFAGAERNLTVAFEAVDTDGDREVSAEEFDLAASTSKLIREAFTTARIARSEDPLFGVLDENGDMRIEMREVHGASTKLLQLLGPETTALRQTDLASNLAITFSPGLRAATNPSLPVNRGERQQYLTAGPSWFVEMDMDANGELSAEEFLGTTHQFQALDRNNDNYIQRDEADAGT